MENLLAKLASLWKLKRDFATADSASKLQEIRRELMLLAGSQVAPAPIHYTADLDSLVEYARGRKYESGDVKNFKEHVFNAFPDLQCVSHGRFYLFLRMHSI
jgi:hypothetical protein